MTSKKQAIGKRSEQQIPLSSLEGDAAAGTCNHEPRRPDGGATIYEIRVKGHLGKDYLAEWFGGMAATVERDGETILTGPVADQAALHGLLARLRDLALPLLSVNRVDLT